VWDAVLPLLATGARVTICGIISQYNGAPENPRANSDRMLMGQILTRSLTVKGFISYEFAYLREKFYADVGSWIAQGRIRYREDFVEGLAAAPAAFIGLLEGKNFGKVLVRFEKGA
jgi:NADPH-dependent curcumin reductase CurA